MDIVSSQDHKTTNPKSKYQISILIGLLAILVIFVVLDALSFAGVIDLQLDNKLDTSQTIKKEETTEQIPTTTKEKDTEPMIPKNWKTYKNSKYKFSIKYPPKWILEDYTKKPSNNNNYGIIIRTKKESLPPRVQIWANRLNYGDYYDYFGTEFNYLYKDEIVKITFAGRKAKEKPGGYDKIVGVTWFKVIHIEDLKGLNWGKGNIISYTADSGQKRKESIDTFDLVLSTFQFLK